MRLLIVTRDEPNDRWIVTKRLPGGYERRTWIYSRLAIEHIIRNWEGVVKYRAKR